MHGTTGAALPATAVLTSLGYSGEHFDAKAQQQYLRARWYNPANGQFNRLDPFAGNMQDPQSLHKYAYVHGDPVANVDPSGLMSLGSMMSSIGITTSNFSAKGAAVYAAKQFAFASVETGVEALIIKLLNSSVLADDPVPFDVGRTLATNFAANLATGGLQKAFLLKNALEVTIRTAADVAYGERFAVSLGTNLVSAAVTTSLSVAGQKLVNRWFKTSGLWDVLRGVDLSTLTNQQVGDLGERIARQMIGRSGFRDIVAIQNASGNGIDIVGRTLDGRIVFFEVKSSRVGSIGDLSSRQQDMSTFVGGILRDASQGIGRYANISDEMQDVAARLLRDVRRDPLSVSGTAVGVDLINQVLRVSPWR